MGVRLRTEYTKCHINAFEFFGGTTATVKIDNLKAAVLISSPNVKYIKRRPKNT